MQKENMQRMIKSIQIKYVYFNFLIIIFSLYQYAFLPIFIPLISCICYQIAQWYFIDRKKGVTQSLNSFLRILGYVFIIFIMYMDHIYFIGLNIFAAISFFIRVNWNCQGDSDKDYATIVQFLKNFSRLSELVACLCITLKLSELVQWTWSQTFWWYWMYLSGLLGLGFTILMVIVTKLLNEYCMSQEDRRISSDYMQLLWIFYFSMSSCIISSLWILNTFQLLNEEIPFEFGLAYFIIVCMVNIIIFSIISYHLFDKLVDFGLKLCNEEEMIDLENKSSQTKKQPKQEIQVMRFLQRLSSAYYKEVVSTQKSPTLGAEIMTERNGSNKPQSNLINIFNPNDAQLKTDPQDSNSQKCLICCVDYPNAVAMPCGHGGLCTKCAQTQKNLCFLCRQKVTEILEIETGNGQYLRVISKTNII